MQLPLKVNKEYFLRHQAWPHNDLLKIKYSVYGIPIPWHRKAIAKGIIKAMTTKFSKHFAISMLKKLRKFCRLGLTHLDATPFFQKSFRYL